MVEELARVVDWLQVALDRDYRRQRQAEFVYLAKRQSLFRRLMNDEITREEYIARLEDEAAAILRGDG